MFLVTYANGRKGKAVMRRQILATSMEDAARIVAELRAKELVSQVQIWKPA